MIIDKNKIDTKFFVNEFTKKFKNFCEKVPLFLNNPIITEKSVTLYTYENKKLLEYYFDFTKDVKSNIYNIRQKLFNNYFPHMTQVITYEHIYDSEMLNYMISNGDISLDEVTPNGGVMEKKKIEWVIEKVIVLRDELHVKNLELNKRFVYQTKIPVTILLKKLMNKDAKEKWNIFEKNTKLKYEGYEVDKEGNLKTTYKGDIGNEDS